MKNSLLTAFCVAGLALTALGQTPAPPPDATTPAPTIASSPAVTASAATPAVPVATATVPTASSAAPTAAPTNDEDFDKMIERKINRHFRVNIDGDHWNHDGDEDPWWIALIVLIGCVAVFGTPIAIVGLILYFSFSRSRAMHKTVRMMVEKGQPVPEALLNPPPVVRQRSDLRRGVILCMVGAGIMVFLGAVNDWEGGAWSLGFIPFIIGLGYLLVWKLDVRKEEASTKV